jgi:predicted enzyme related to lactoylglutathione lyase
MQTMCRAPKFCQTVFGWSLEPWGHPNLYLIETGKEQVTAVRGLLQEPRELARGQKMMFKA